MQSPIFTASSMSWVTSTIVFAMLLEDDKGLQPADNPIALINKPKATANVRQIVEAVNTKLDSAAYNEMALKVLNDNEDPSDVVAEWLQAEGLAK